MSQLAPAPEPPSPDASSDSLEISRESDASAPEKNSEKTSGKNSEKTYVLDVEGMMCAACVSTVEKTLAQCEGVVSQSVNLVTEMAAIACEPTVNPDAIAQALTDAGYPSTLRQSEDSAGLSAETDWLARQQAAQTAQKNQVAIALLLLALSTLGHLQHFGLRPDGWAKPFLTLPILSTLWFHGLLATLTLIFPARKILIEGFEGFRRGSPNMNSLVSLGALSAYTTSLAAWFFPGLGWACFFDEPVMLLSFILLGRTLEQRAQFQAASSLRSLIALQPTLARLIPDPQASKEDGPTDVIAADIQIPTDQVKVGDWLRVLPGEKVPVDGKIEAGSTALDESLLTGESLPVVKQPGDEVIAGTLNQSGAISLQVSRTGANTTLGQMIQLVETAQTRKAPIQGLADVISGYFTYGVLTCAALTFCFWYFVGAPLWPAVAQSAMGAVHHAGHHAGHHMGHYASRSMEQMSAASASLPLTQSLRLLVSLKLAIAVVVVACPCALGLATPTAILVGSGIGAEKGLLIRGGDILEATRNLDRVVFDKTGTLTTGHPVVTDCIALEDTLMADQLLQIAATVESGTRHPLSLAIQQAANEKGLVMLPAENFLTQAGRGVSATLLGEEDVPTSIYIGNQNWLTQNGCSLNLQTIELAEGLASAGKTVVFVGRASSGTEPAPIGLLGVADTLRPDADKALSDLQKMGLSVQMLSGDRQAAALAIATQLGLLPSQVQANVSPAGKVDAIAALQSAGHRVGFVGDGINDAPALAQADIGIALNSGTEVAMETADIVLMGDELSDVLSAIALSRATFNTIRQNLTWAFAYNLICIPLAAGAFLPAFGLSLNPGFAGGLMALSSITVVLNSLRLRWQ
ncbi:MAG: heavy metal translocating P-type ATPase [Cyanobacteria bacterium J06631_9]